MTRPRPTARRSLVRHAEAAPAARVPAPARLPAGLLEVPSWGSPAAMANELGLRNVSFEVDDLQAAVDWAGTEGYGLVGGIEYVDCLTDDARLTLENVLFDVTAPGAGVTIIEAWELAATASGSPALRRTTSADRLQQSPSWIA